MKRLRRLATRAGAALLVLLLLYRGGLRLLAGGDAGVPRHYLEAAVIWAYLDQVKGESFEEIVARSESMEELLEEALSQDRGSGG